MTTTNKSYHPNPLVSDAMLRAGTAAKAAALSAGASDAEAAKLASDAAKTARSEALVRVREPRPLVYPLAFVDSDGELVLAVPKVGIALVLVAEHLGISIRGAEQRLRDGRLVLRADVVKPGSSVAARLEGWATEHPLEAYYSSVESRERDFSEYQRGLAAWLRSVPADSAELATRSVLEKLEAERVAA